MSSLPPAEGATWSLAWRWRWGSGFWWWGPRENLFHTMPGVHQFDEWGPAVFEALYESEFIKAVRVLYPNAPELVEYQVRTFWRN